MTTENDPGSPPPTDLGVGGPADIAGDDVDQPTTPEGYPESVDPSQGPLAGRDADEDTLGDLRDPGAESPS